MQKRLFFWIILLSLLALLAACATPAPPPAETTEAQPATAEPAEEPAAAPATADLPPRVLISEVLTGATGNNNTEFIELYNTSTEAPFDLKGWSIWYKLADDQQENLVYRWSEHALIPPQGHYLLVREGQDVGVPEDTFFGQPLVGPKGALQLRQTDGSVLDSLAWGTGPADYTEGQLAAAMENGISLERLPGGETGNRQDTDNNLADFALISAPSPQNSGSQLSPNPAEKLAIQVAAPATAEPGTEFDFNISVTNQTHALAENVTAQVPIPLEFEVVAADENIQIGDQAAFWELKLLGKTHHIAVWTVGSLAAGETASANITVRVPWTVFTAQVANYSVQADGSLPIFGGPVRTAVEGGVIPINRLPELINSQMSIEGTVTMPTGALYAGGGNVKFYLEDETGGVQVWVPGGEGEVAVAIGAKVRVFGDLTLYRGALELIVNDPADVEVTIGSAAAGAPPAATTMTVDEAKNRPEYQGMLGQIEGQVIRVDEFSYSYEIDILDEAGDVILLYVDKQTNINVEAIEPGQFYKVTGVIEIYDTEQQMYPRVQSDFERVYPPILTIEMNAPITIASEDLLEVTLTAYNYTPETLTDLQIVAPLPLQGVTYVSASEGGSASGGGVAWTIPELAGNGASAQVSYQVQTTLNTGFLSFSDYSASAAEWPEPATGVPFFVFLGDTVPIWAIQGTGTRSPYILEKVTTAGTVTGIFPELGGFWIQEAETDSDPATSAGLFVQTGDLKLDIAAGDLLQIDGTVRETSQQTLLLIEREDDVLVLQEGGALPAAVELNPPADLAESLAYYESLEGMLVQVSAAAPAVSPQSKYGEYMLVRPEHGITRLWQGDTVNNGLGIMVDDGSAAVHEDRSGLPYIVNAGDQVGMLIGPLAYTYGQYKIEPITVPVVNPGVVELPSLQTTGSDEFSIMTWNVENLFDTRAPHPSDPPMMSGTEYRAAIAKVANTIVAAGAPIIVGLQEVENIGILEEIAAHEALAAFNYQPYLIEGTDSRGIDNGYLVRSDVAEVINVVQEVAPEGLTSRPPLVIEVEIQTDSGPVTVFVANNHFTSMSAGEVATEPRRNAQAAWNVTVLENLQKEYGNPLVAIIGDLNSFYEALPIDTLRAAGLNHVFEIIPAEARYTYIYQGASQTLDHILVTPSLFDLIQRTEVLHVNADYAPPVAGDESPLRKSDHDPVVATFSLSK